MTASGTSLTDSGALAVFGKICVDVVGLEGVTFDFVPMLEPKSGPNRVHWDLRALDVQPLRAAAAQLVRNRAGDVDWDVLADPRGTSSACRSADEGVAASGRPSCGLPSCGLPSCQKQDA